MWSYAHRLYGLGHGFIIWMVSTTLHGGAWLVGDAARTWAANCRGGRGVMGGGCWRCVGGYPLVGGGRPSWALGRQPWWGRRSHGWGLVRGRRSSYVGGKLSLVGRGRLRGVTGFRLWAVVVVPGR